MNFYKLFEIYIKNYIMKTLSKFLALLSALIFSVQLFAQTENSPVISADKMNLLYIGIENPVSVAVPGIANDQLQVSITNGTITGSNGKYVVKVQNGTEAIIEVSAKAKSGEVTQLGSQAFRIKRIPVPAMYLGNTPCVGSVIYTCKNELLKNPQLTMNSELPFEMKFDVISFTLTHNVSFGENKDLVSYSANGNRFNQNMIAGVEKLPAGSKIYIEDIKVKSPDATVRQMASLVIKLVEE